MTTPIEEKVNRFQIDALEERIAPTGGFGLVLGIVLGFGGGHGDGGRDDDCRDSRKDDCGDNHHRKDDCGDNHHRKDDCGDKWKDDCDGPRRGR